MNPMTTSRKILADNLRALIEKDGSNIRAWSLKNGLQQRNIDRIVKAQSAATIDTLDEIASAAGVASWHLLIEDLDSESPPKLAVSAEELKLFERLQKLATPKN